MAVMKFDEGRSDVRETVVGKKALERKRKEYTAGIP